MNKYGVVIYWSDEDEAYIAEVPELPGCLTHGDTLRAAAQNAEEAIRLWVETAKEFKRAVPEPKRRRMALKPVASEHVRLRKQQPAAASPGIRWTNKARHYSRIMNPRSR